jgi:hypothetical protein
MNEAVVEIDQVKRMTLAYPEKRGGNFVHRHGAALGPLIEAKDQGTGFVLQHHPTMDGYLIHRWDFDPVATAAVEVR